MLVTFFITSPNTDLAAQLSSKHSYELLMNLDAFEVFQPVAVTSLTGAQTVPPPPGGLQLDTNPGVFRSSLASGLTLGVSCPVPATSQSSSDLRLGAREAHHYWVDSYL